MWNRSCNTVKLMYKSKNLRNYVSWDVYSRRNSQRRNSLTILALKNLCHVSPPEESPRTEMVYNIDEAGTLGHAGPETPWWQVRELKTHHSNLKSSCKQSWARDNTAATTTWPCFQATIHIRCGYYCRHRGLKIFQMLFSPWNSAVPRCRVVVVAKLNIVACPALVVKTIILLDRGEARWPEASVGWPLHDH